MGYIEDGRETEYAFIEDFLKCFPNIKRTNVRKTLTEEDINDHVDFEIFGNGGSNKFDVKGLRKVNRSDAEPDPTKTWVELRTVRGEIGSLYGKADNLVFELIDSWLIVKRNSVVDFIKHKVKDTSVYTKPRRKPELYTRYQRENKNDEIVLVDIEDLKEFVKKFKIIKKTLA